jgi:hypothetical protein
VLGTVQKTKLGSNALFVTFCQMELEILEIKVVHLGNKCISATEMFL